MALTAKKKGSFELAPEGVHQAICVTVVDLGTHLNPQFKKRQRKVLIGWELPDELIKVEDKELPMIVYQRYTNSLDKKAALKPMLEAWRGRAFTDAELDAFDLFNILGAPCQLQIIHEERNGQKYANVKAVMSMPKGLPRRKATNTLKRFSMEEGFDIPADYPDWIRDSIMESDEYKAHAPSSMATDAVDGIDVPEEVTGLEPF